jgi:hypothetical protein
VLRRVSATPHPQHSSSTISTVILYFKSAQPEPHHHRTTTTHPFISAHPHGIAVCTSLNTPMALVLHHSHRLVLWQIASECALEREFYMPRSVLRMRRHQHTPLTPHRHDPFLLSSPSSSTSCCRGSSSQCWPWCKNDATKPAGIAHTSGHIDAAYTPVGVPATISCTQHTKTHCVLRGE